MPTPLSKNEKLACLAVAEQNVSQPAWELLTQLRTNGRAFFGYSPAEIEAQDALEAAGWPGFFSMNTANTLFMLFKNK